MSLRAFTDGINRDILRGSSRGAQMTRIYTSPEGMKVLIAGAMKETSEAMDLVPEVRIHGVPVREHAKMPTGHVWYLYKGGKQ